MCSTEVFGDRLEGLSSVVRGAPGRGVPARSAHNRRIVAIRFCVFRRNAESTKEKRCFPAVIDPCVGAGGLGSGDCRFEWKVRDVPSPPLPRLPQRRHASPRARSGRAPREPKPRLRIIHSLVAEAASTPWTELLAGTSWKACRTTKDVRQAILAVSGGPGIEIDP